MVNYTSLTIGCQSHGAEGYTTNMTRTDYQSIDEYIAIFPYDVQERLETIRQTIHKAVPEAQETISYQVPCFNLNGPILYFSAYKSHIGVAAPPPTMEDFKDELTAYKTSKSTVQLPHDQPLPLELIEKLARHRAAENLGRQTAES